MRVVCVVCVVWGWLGAFAQNVNDIRNLPKYDERYDYLDVDGILDSKRLVHNYVECLINVKPCTPEGKALKRILPEALRSKCVRCTDKQKKTAVKVIKRLKYDYPEEWAKLSSRWDPTGDFTRFFEEYLTKDQSNIIPNDNNVIPVRPPPPPPPPKPTVVMILTSSKPSKPASDGPTTPRPAILNRFGEDGDLMTGDKPSAKPPVMMTSSSTRLPVSVTRPTQGWMAAASEPMPTRFPLRPPTDMPPPFSTAITLIDQIGFKIIRTTELVTDILRNTVRAVVGR